MSRLKRFVSLAVVYLACTAITLGDCTIGNLYPIPTGNSFDYSISGSVWVYSSGTCSDDCMYLGHTYTYLFIWTSCWYLLEANSYSTGAGLAHDGRAIDWFGGYGVVAYGYNNCDGDSYQSFIVDHEGCFF